ncbi:limbin isoform X10 [Corvus cornix cornix]|uniref:limbin isoform X10 n=1 Tax=Corvus cornix cornix TaxID=932674 RepID=UPI00194E6EC7|nr:limbin isoform X10 [Corvus cornix cornix]
MRCLLAGLLLALLPGGPSAPARPLVAATGRGPAREPCGRTAAGVFEHDLWLQKEMGCLGMAAVPLRVVIQASKASHQLLTSAASDNQWSHSLFALIPSWTKKVLFKRESDVSLLLPEDVSNMSVSSEFGITLQKCGMVDVEHDPQTAYITLVVNNTNTLLSTNITDLILLDNITGLHVQETSGNKTTDGIQIYRKKSLQGGEHFAINYSALLDAEGTWHGRVLTLPAKLTFRSSSQNKTHLVSLTASFTITEEEKTKVNSMIWYYIDSPAYTSGQSKILYSHGISASGFFIAFFVSLVLTCAVFFIIYQTQILKWSFCSKNQEIQPEHNQNHKLEHSQFNSGDLFSEDTILNDQIIDILSFEEPGNMLQALEDLEVASLTRADADLEACRTQICKEVIAMMLKNMALNHSLFPHVEKKISSVFKKRFLAMEKEIQEEYERKMVALTAECHLETRKTMEAQCQKARAANGEAEELMRKINEKPAVEYRSLLDRLHRLEQDCLKRFLFVKQEEYFAKAYRELAVTQRKELHTIFFTQITNATLKGELKLEAAKTLVEGYSKIQGDIEELMDFLQACKKYHLNKRFSYREYLVSKIQSRCSHVSALINAAAAQISSLINKTERQLLSLPLSLSEEELLRMRQELHCCFSQVDSSLAWPKIRARTLLQAFEVEQKDTEVLKVEQNLAMTCKQQHSKMGKTGSRNRNKLDILKKSLQEKILIYEDSVKGENLNRIKYELQLEKECHLRNLENKLGEFIASVAFQKTVKKSKMLELYTAIINVQALLFEQLNTSKTLSKLECIQILEAHNPEIEELDRKLEYEMLHKESAQQHLMSRQRWILDGLGLSNEAVDTNAERHVTVLLRQAMNKCRQFINLYQQSLRDEQWNCMVLEDLLENIEMDAFLAIYSQELHLAGYLAKLTRVPMGMLHRVLNLLLPSSSQSEVLSVLDSISKYSDGVVESDSNADESGSCKKRRNQELWQTLENKVRQDLINSLEKIPSLNKRKDSLIKKKQLAVLENAAFIHLGCSPAHPPVEQPDPPVSLNSATAEAIELLDTGEKILLFREPSDPLLALHNFPRKKKKNFLNSKKTARANMDS